METTEKTRTTTVEQTQETHLEDKPENQNFIKNFEVLTFNINGLSSRKETLVNIVFSKKYNFIAIQLLWEYSLMTQPSEEALNQTNSTSEPQENEEAPISQKKSKRILSRPEQS